MKTIGNRLRKLEDRIFPDTGQPQRLWVAILAGSKFALDTDKCVDILRECGFLPKARFAILNFCGIPHGLNAEELEEFLRRNGAETCGFGGNQSRLGTEGATPQGETGLLNHAQMSAGVLR